MGGSDAGAEWTTEVVEALAVAYHQLYRDRFPHEPTAALSWDELPADLQETNRSTARSLPGELAVLGYSIRCRPAVADGRRVDELPPDHVDVLARAEHVRWVRDKQADGYVHGSERDDDVEPPTHPDMVGWDDLDDEDRCKDAIRYEAAPRLLADLGYEMVRTPLG